MSEPILIKIPNLMLDVDNYRIEHQDGQPQVIKAIIEEQDGKLVTLAKDIVKHGLSPIEPLLVMPANNSKTQFVVIEGNRRVTSIKLVENLTWQLARVTKLTFVS